MFQEQGEIPACNENCNKKTNCTTNVWNGKKEIVV